jgi:hypothetical protein
MHPLLKYLEEQFPAFKGHKLPDELFRPTTYLALPYTYRHEDPAVQRRMQQWRFELGTQAAAWLMNTQGWNVFSPITHSHPLHVQAQMRGDWEFWKQVDTEYLQVSCRIVVLGLDGWRDSTGVTAELAIAKDFGIPRYFLEPKPDGDFYLHHDLSTSFFNDR